MSALPTVTQPALAMPALTRSPMSALSNWARFAIIPNTSSPCGVVVSTFSW